MHPSKSVQPHRSKPRIGSQEPRRPRFSFFYSSLCQRADLTPSPAGTSRKHRFQILSGKPIFSGHPADRQPFQIALISGSTVALASSTLAGCSRDVFVCQHPVFRFSFQPDLFDPTNPKLESLNSKSLSFSDTCFRRWHLAAPRSQAMSGL